MSAGQNGQAIVYIVVQLGFRNYGANNFHQNEL